MLDSAAVPDVPDPVPYREIFVHGPTVEGVHLRAGPVARGGHPPQRPARGPAGRGPRPDATQVLKNALIVPTGRRAGSCSAAPRSRRKPRCGWPTRPSSGACSTSSTRTRTRTWSSPRTRAPPRSATSPTASRSNGATGWATRSHRVGRSATTTGPSGSRPAAPGWPSTATSGSSTSTSPPTRSARSASGTCRATCSATGCCWPGMRLLAAFDHRDVFFDPDPDRGLAGRAGPSARAGRFVVAGLRPSLISEGGGVFSRSLKRIELTPASRPRSGRRPTR